MSARFSGVALIVALAMSCAGRSIERAQDGVETGGTRSQSSTGGTQGTAAAPGTGGTSGSAPVAASGGASTSVGGSSGATASGAAPSARGGTGSGATPGRAGRGGRSTSAGGRPGTSTGGDAGELQAGTDPGTGEGGHGGEPVTCTDDFTQAPSGMRCSDGEAYAQGPTFVLVAGATKLSECLDACRARPDCRAVSDYFTSDVVAACAITHDACDEPAKPIWSEEDGGLTHRKSCDGESCSYESLGSFHCAEQPVESFVTGATSLDDCIQACDADESCTAVIDYFYLLDVFGHCFMSVGTCSSQLVNAEEGVFHLRHCE